VIGRQCSRPGLWFTGFAFAGLLGVSIPVAAQPQSPPVQSSYPDRFLFGTDEVAPPDQEKYLKVYNQYGPLWSMLDQEASEKVRKGNYQRIFDEARRKVRAWERAHPTGARAQ